MKIEDLHLLLAVAKGRSFAAAARELDLDPSAVSRTVAEIEKTLGARLFQRSTRRLALTEAGQSYLARLEAPLEELAQAGEEVAAGGATARGSLRLTASVGFGQARLVPLLAQFQRRYPRIRLSCLFTDARLDLIAERIDLAIRLTARVTGDVVATKLMDTPYRVVATRAYLARAAPLQKPTDLARHRVVLADLPHFRDEWLFRDAQGALQHVLVDGDVTLSPVLAVHGAVLNDLGPALLPSWLVDADISAGRLVRLLPGYAATATTFDRAAWLLYPSRAFMPQRVRVAIDFLKECFAQVEGSGRGQRGKASGTGRTRRGR